MRVLILLMLLSLPSFAGEKHWQDAVIIKYATSQGPLVAAPVAGTWVAGRVVWLYYVVDTADTRYELATRRTVNITLKKQTKLATDGLNAFLQDDDGKTVKLRIVEKLAIASPPQTAPSSAQAPAQASTAVPH